MPGTSCSSTRSSCSRRSDSPSRGGCDRSDRNRSAHFAGQRLIGIGRAAAHHRGANRLPGVVVDPLVVAGWPGPAAAAPRPGRRGAWPGRGAWRRSSVGPTRKSPSNWWLKSGSISQRTDRAAAGPRPRSATAISRTARRVLKVLAHELLDRQQALRPADSFAGLGQPQLLGAVEHVVGLARAESAGRCAARAESRGPRAAARCSSLRQPAGLAQRVEIALAVADEADPADELQIAQAAAGALDVRLEQEDRFAVLARALRGGPLRPPRAAAASGAASCGGSGRRTGRTAPRRRAISRDSASDVRIVASSIARPAGLAPACGPQKPTSMPSVVEVLREAPHQRLSRLAALATGAAASRRRRNRAPSRGGRSRCGPRAPRCGSSRLRAGSAELVQGGLKQVERRCLRAGR